MTAGSLLVDQGQTGREAFVILDGDVTVKRNGRKVATLGPGAIVGELSLLDHGPRTATAVCETDCTLFVISQRNFMPVLDDVPTISTSSSPPWPAASATSTAPTTAEPIRVFSAVRVLDDRTPHTQHSDATY